MIQRARPNIAELFAAGTPIDEAISRGIRQALLRHKRLGESIIVAGEDGNPIRLPPEEIPVDDAEFAPTPSQATPITAE
jgi:hypothetical protein